MRRSPANAARPASSPKRRQQPPPSPDSPFVALDFETANPSPDSACAIGLVTCAGGKIVDKQHFFIRPPSQLFTFSWCHGITWEQVKDKPTFAQLWPQIKRTLDEAEFLAAHNASFDRKVLEACCRSAGHAPGERSWVCTVQLARSTWQLRPTKLSDCARFLNLELNHHEALSDAQACANIVLAAARAARAARPAAAADAPRPTTAPRPEELPA